MLSPIVLKELPFPKAFLQLMLAEGGYSNNPRDTGGETMYGITLAVARRHGYTGAMKALDIEFAKAIYKKDYWPAYLESLPYTLAYQLFDSNVNSGTSQTTLWLQRALGVKADGVVGPKTVAALLAAPAKDIAILFLAARLTAITAFATWDEFGKGWARRIATNLELLASENSDK